MARGMPPTVDRHGGQRLVINHFIGVNPGSFRWRRETSVKDGLDHELIRGYVAAAQTTDAENPLQKTMNTKVFKRIKTLNKKTTV